MKMYLLMHIYCYGEEDEYGEGEHMSTKELGIYSTKEKAEQAKEFYCALPGFNRHPADCFSIITFEVDINEKWNGGFLTYDEASGLADV